MQVHILENEPKEKQSVPYRADRAAKWQNSYHSSTICGIKMKAADPRRLVPSRSLCFYLMSQRTFFVPALLWHICLQLLSA